MFKTPHLICEKQIEELVEFGEDDSKDDEGGHQAEHTGYSQTSVSLGLLAAMLIRM